MALDTFQDIEARLQSHDFVLKCLINGINQVMPQAGLGPAMRQMLQNSVSNLQVNGDAPAGLITEVKDRILSHSLSIVDDALNARRGS